MIRALAVLILFIGQVARAETDTAFTGYEKIIDAAFSPAEINRSYIRPSDGEARALENVRGTVIQLIQTVRPTWMSAIAGDSPATEADQRAVIEVLKSTPIYLCSKGCQCGSSPNGCAKGKAVGGSIAAILTLESCALTAKGCPNDFKRKQGAEKRLLQFFSSGFFQIAYWKLNGLKKFNVVSNQKERDRSQAIFEDALSRMTRLRSACPRKFPEWGLPFLKSTQSLIEANATQARCAQRILSSLMSGKLPQSCSKIIDAVQFSKIFSNNLFRMGFKVAHCDSNCAIMICGESPSTDARLIRFGEKKWMAIIPDSLCEGQFPVNPTPLLKDALQWVSAADDPSRNACAEELYKGPIFNREKSEGMSEKGTDIELIPVE